MRGRARASGAIAAGAVAVWAVAMTVPHLSAAQGQAQHPGQPDYAQADIEAGYRVYTANCVGCHGPNGDTVGTVNLKSGQFRRASNDFELMALIANGIPAAGMPGHRFASAEMTAVIAYLRNMREFDGRAVALGDASRGKTIFEGKGGCAACHRANGAGSRLAPDLSDIGSVRAASTLLRAVVDPTSQLFPINRPVHIVLTDGKRINGRRLNEDTFTIQLVDDQGRLLSLDKSEIKELKIQTTASMPSFKDKLSSEELADVIAYLVSLKG